MKRAVPTVVLMAIVTAVFWPLVYVAFDIVRGLLREGFPADVVSVVGLRRLAWSLAIGGGIAAGAVLIAWPVAWGIRHRPWRWSPLVIAPMLLPSYFAYTAWGLARSPGSLVGDWLARGPVWRIRAFEHMLAMGGLALWAWPIAAVVLVVGFRRLDGDVLSALRVEAMSWRWRVFVIARINARYMAAAWALVTLVMLGSAVPLHVGQIETFAINIWLRLAQASPAHWWGVWVFAWPLVVLAVGGGAGAWALGGRAMKGGGYGASDAPSGYPFRATSALAAFVWIVSVIAPLWLLAWSLREWGGGWSSIMQFIRFHGDTLGRSLAIALVSGAMCMVIAVLVSMQAGRHQVVRTRWRGLAGWIVAGMVIVGLLPGVLIGVALSAAWGSWGLGRWMLDSPAIVVCGHIARFGFIGALVGWWLAMSESDELSMLRMLDGADGIDGWWRTCWPWQAGGLIGVGLACAALGLHEIEASIMLEPPGHEGLARLMLGMLHFSRLDELSAGTLIVVGASALVASMATAILVWTQSRRV